MAVLAVTAGAWTGYQQIQGARCSGSTALQLAASPEIAPVLQSAVERWAESDGGAAVDGVCVEVTVTAVDSANLAAAIAGRSGTTLTGVGQASGSVQIPDVWVPDSSIWLLRLREAASFAPALSESVAQSPVVVAMPEPVATGLGWPEQQLGWADLLQRIGTDTRLRTGIVEPSRDAAGLSGLLALGSAALGAGPNAQQAMAGALRTLALGRSVLRDDLLARFPASPEPEALASSLGAAPLSEQAVIAYNAQQPPVPLAALYLEPAPLALDYPYTVLSGLDGRQSAAAEAFLGRLSGDGYRGQLAARGLRAADGAGGAGFTAPTAAPQSVGPATPATAAPTSEGEPGGSAAGGADPAAIERALNTWLSITRPARMLAVIDVSGSMLIEVPTAGGATRGQVTNEAARRGLGLFDDSWALGLWIFSTELDGDKDYRELVPIGPLATQRSQLLSALGDVVPKPDGNTGLHDTIMAAYLAVQEGWDPGRVNSVVVMTDGDNFDPTGGLTLDQLTSQLAEAADPERPIQLIIVGIGPDVTRDKLEPITQVTGGGVFIAEDPADIGEIFLQAISLRAQPR